MRDIVEFQTKQEESSKLTEKFRKIEILESFFTEQVSKKMGLDRILIQSIVQGNLESDEQMIDTLTDLILKLTDAKNTVIHGEVNEQICKIETQIIGVVTGKMIALDDVEYAPEIFDGHPDLPLWSLHQVAEQTYISYKRQDENTVATLPSKVLPFLHDLKRSA